MSAFSTSLRHLSIGRLVPCDIVFHCDDLIATLAKRVEHDAAIVFQSLT